MLSTDRQRNLEKRKMMRNTNRFFFAEMGCEKGRDVIPRDFGRAFVLMQNSNGCLCSKKRADDGGMSQIQ